MAGRGSDIFEVDLESRTTPNNVEMELLDLFERVSRNVKTLSILEQDSAGFAGIRSVVVGYSHEPRGKCGDVLTNALVWHLSQDPCLLRCGHESCLIRCWPSWWNTSVLLWNLTVRRW